MSPNEWGDQCGQIETGETGRKQIDFWNLAISGFVRLFNVSVFFSHTRRRNLVWVGPSSHQRAVHSRVLPAWLPRCDSSTLSLCSAEPRNKGLWLCREAGLNQSGPLSHYLEEVTDLRFHSANPSLFGLEDPPDSLFTNCPLASIHLSPFGDLASPVPHGCVVSLPWPYSDFCTPRTQMLMVAGRIIDIHIKVPRVEYKGEVKKCTLNADCWI